MKIIVLAALAIIPISSAANAASWSLSGNLDSTCTGDCAPSIQVVPIRSGQAGLCWQAAFHRRLHAGHTRPPQPISTQQPRIIPRHRRRGS